MPKTLEISIEGKVYRSVAEASRQIGMSSSRVYARLDSIAPEWKDWYYLSGFVRGEKVPKDYPFAFSYRLTHLPTGKFYVGSTKDYIQRKCHHMWQLRNNRHTCKKLQELWDCDSNLANWKWISLVFDHRQEAYDHEQEELDTHRHNPLLLNSVINARSPIEEVMLRDGFKERATQGYKRAMKNLTAEDRLALKEKWRQGVINRWSKDNAKDQWKGAGNPFAKKVSVDGTVYGSVKDAQAQLGISEKTIRKRANSPDHPNYTFNV